MVAVRWQLSRTDGTPETGYVLFTPRVEVTNDRVSFTRGRVRAPLDDTGLMVTDLLATDDPGNDQASWTYLVEPKLSNGSRVQPFDLDVPYSATGVGIDLADVAPAVPGHGDPTAFVTLSAFDQLVSQLPDTYDRTAVALTPEAVLRAEFIRSKGYAIGTSGRAAVALRFDHWLNVFGATVLPLLRARDLPSGLCVYSRMLTPGDTYWDSDSANYTWTDVQNWCVKDGVEVWSHSRSHADTPHTGGFAALVDEIVTSKSDLEARMPKVKVQGWMMPGVTLTGGATLPYIDFDTTDLRCMWTTDAGRLLRQTYPVAEVYMTGYVRTLPTGPIHGADHYTMDDRNLAELQVVLDDAIGLGVGIEFMVHPGFVGAAGHITLADFTAFLDYIVAKRNAGLLEVVTPSGLYLADKERKGRAELVTGGDFAPPFNPTTNRGRWSTHVGGMALMTDTDGTTKFLRIPTTSTIFNQANTQLGRLGFSGETFMAEVKVRQVGGAVTARLQVEDAADITRWQDNYTLTVPAGSGWTTWRQLFTVPRTTTSFRLYAGRSGGGELDITGVRAYKV